MKARVKIKFKSKDEAVVIDWLIYLTNYDNFIWIKPHNKKLPNILASGIKGPKVVKVTLCERARPSPFGFAVPYHFNFTHWWFRFRTVQCFHVVHARHLAINVLIIWIFNYLFIFSSL